MDERIPSPLRSPAQLAWERFVSRRSSQVALVVIGLIIAMGIYAPFLSNEVALVWWDHQGLRFPAITGLWCLRRQVRQARRVLIVLIVIVGGGVLCSLPVIPLTSGMSAVWEPRPFSQSTIQQWQELPENERPFALFAPIKHRFDATYPGATLQAPGSVNPLTGGTYWLGTDGGGHDVLTILFFGARVSLTVGLVAAGLAFVIGVLIGAVSGYFGGWVDLLLQRLVEIMMCFPTFILILTVVAMLDRDIFIIMIVIGLTGWAGVARLVRGEFLAQSVRDYVLAAEALGLSRSRIMFRHILPNTVAPLLISLTFGIAGSIGAESTLAFVGLGDPTVPSWGVLMEQGRLNIRYPWLIYTPGLAIFTIVMTLNLLGNNLRDAIDPKNQR